MRVLLIAYSLKGKESEYDHLFEVIKNSGTKWWHYLDSVWLIKTNKTADELGKELSEVVRKSEHKDHVMVIEVVGFSQGFMPSVAWDWINEHISRKAAKDDS